MGWILFFIGLSIGLTLAIFVGAWKEPEKPVGDLFIVDSEDGTYLFVELNSNVDELASAKSIQLNVKNQKVTPKTH